MKKTVSTQGFTLIELSIVLVIIGLIVGGVLVGQDLIKGAEIRATVSQLEKFDAAANTFRGKYNGLPGDILNAGNYGLSVTGLTGDGDSFLDRTTDNGTSYDLESAAFFKQLALANMIAENIAGTDVTITSVDTETNYAPAAKVGQGNLIYAYGNSGNNYYALSAATVENGVLTFSAGTEMAVIDAFNIDSKLDDGKPTTGRVMAVTNLNTADAGAAAANDICVDTDQTPDGYNTGTSARANDTECTLRVRTSF